MVLLSATTGAALHDNGRILTLSVDIVGPALASCILNWSRHVMRSSLQIASQKIGPIDLDATMDVAQIDAGLTLSRVAVTVEHARQNFTLICIIKNARSRITQ